MGDRCEHVTPFVGVWIETPSNVKTKPGSEVTPFVGVWIETAYVAPNYGAEGGHTLRGCVD